MTNRVIRKLTGATAVISAGVLLFGCAGTKIGLSEDTLASLRITEVRVTAPANASIQWDEEAGNYLRAKGIKRPRGAGGRARDENSEIQAATGKYLAALNSADTKRYVRSAFLAKVKAATQKAVSGWPNGQRPARLNVVVTNAREASAFIQVLIGPTNSSVSTKLTLVDVASGAVYGKPTNITGISSESGGFIGVAIAAARSPKMDRVVADYSAKVKSWLARKK